MPEQRSRTIGRLLRRHSVVLAALAIIAATIGGVTATGSPAGADPVPGFVFRGGGWGHGVGMSQYGARAMAADGRTAGQILAHYYQNTSIGSVGELADLRVHLTDSNEITLSTGGWMSFTHGGVDINATSEGQSIRIYAHDGGLQIGSVWAAATSDAPVMVSFPSPVKVSATGHEYLWGKLQLSARNGQVRVVESDLSMEHYVAGMAEMPSSWGAEALKAQAIAARTYAYNVTVDRRTSSNWNVGYDISASTTDQHYIGWDAQNDDWDQPWVQAAADTAGSYVLYNGSPIRAYYSASSGGHTEHGGLVFANAGPWVTGVDDPYDLIDNPWSEWERHYSIEELTRWLNRAPDTSIGTLVSIRVDGALGISKRIDKATVHLVGTAGSAEIDGRRLMLVLNAGLFAEGLGLDRHLPSTLASIVGGDGTPTATDTAPPASSESAVPIGATEFIGDPATTMQFAGWALDPDVPSDAIEISVVVDGEVVRSETADVERPEIAQSNPAAGPFHGFSFSVELSPGSHRICLIAKDHNGERDLDLPCADVEIPDGTAEPAATPEPTPTPEPAPEPTATPGAAPIAVTVSNPTVVQAEAAPVTSISSARYQMTLPPEGEVETVSSPARGQLFVKGWSFDPDSPGAVAIQVRVDGQAVETRRAGDLRPDIQAAYDHATDRSGFEATIDVAPGEHTVCVVLYNSGEGPDLDLDCARVTVAS